METQSILKKIGTSQHLLIPKSYIDVYKLDLYEYKLEILDDGRTIQFKRLRKIDKTQLKLSDFNKKTKRRTKK